ncbi:receptor-type tyrosine-protein phosphatase alpha-like [Hyalella azteca]|uniref:Receptor-type tyrosine-protein phosphatase alpha-like n=1 Tax=Hyalella azteca TaxID=294128 RepID=A0A8B7NBA8_HYAAZ|nr:receptor-type tyrosine-protein phosphatase alpha-like [Hyalella azteca]
MANIETFLNKSIGSLYMKHKFSSIPVNRDKPTRVAALAGNLKKNRYGNNLPYDDTRVHLLEIDDYAAYIDPHSDYINASHITGAGPHRRYIAAQGPKSEELCTIPDFWRMIDEQQVNVIIMIGDFIEDNAESCGQYFSYDGVVMLQDPPVSVMVTMLSTETPSSYNVSRIQVKMEVEGKSVLRDVTHYHYAAWPQQGDPSDTLALASMLLDIASSHPKSMLSALH